MKLRNKKTGEIGDFLCAIQDDDIKLWSNTNCYEMYHYKSLSEFHNNWEDYKPKEPLIKDEKIRKAVRAWAEAIETNGCTYDEFWEAFRFGNHTIAFKGKYRIGESLGGLEDGKSYTIIELCGEEGK